MLRLVPCGRFRISWCCRVALKMCGAVYAETAQIPSGYVFQRQPTIGNGRAQIHCPAFGVCKGKTLRMEHQAGNSCVGRKCAVLMLVTVLRVAENGVPEMPHVQADLMIASGVRSAAQQAQPRRSISRDGVRAIHRIPQGQKTFSLHGEGLPCLWAGVSTSTPQKAHVRAPSRGMPFGFCGTQIAACMHQWPRSLCQKQRRRWWVCPICARDRVGLSAPL